MTERYVSGQFYVVLAIGATISVLVFAMAPLFAELYQEPDIEPIVRVISPVFLISSFGSVPQALLERRLAFRVLAASEIAAAGVASAASVAVAVSGGGVWSLVVQSMTLAAIASLAYVIAARWRPQITFGWSEMRAATRFGAALTTSNVSAFIMRNADYFLIGRVLGATQLGYYSLAYRIMAVPVQLTSGAFGRVLYPVVSRAQHDLSQARALYISALGAITFVAMPLGAMLAVTAHRLVPVIVGPGWEPVVPVLQILALVTIAQSVGATTGPIWMATGHVDEMAGYGIVSAVVVVAGFVVGVQHGIVGVALSYLLTSVVVLLVPSLWLALRHIGLPLRVVPAVVWRNALAAIVAALGVIVIEALVAGSSDLGMLVIDLVVGAALYLAFTLALNRGQLVSLLSFVGADRRRLSRLHQWLSNSYVVRG